jgi:Ca2+:H+ antiporter
MTDSPALHPLSITSLAREEWFIGVSAATSLIFLAFPDPIFARIAEPFWFVVIFFWLFAVVLGSALSVVRHADHLAEQLREPYGTLILTLAITSIEVMAISAVMLHGENNPTLARDTLFAVVMIILNGMVGLSLLFGAWRREDQQHNLHGANAYLGVIVPLATLGLVMPTFLAGPDGPHPTAARQMFLGIVSIGLYSIFLLLQSGRHQRYFAEDGNNLERRAVGIRPHRGVWHHAVLLLAYMGPVVFLVEQLAKPIDYVIETLHAPAAFGGVIMAVLVATPEAISAVRASVANHLQRAINIFLGSVLSTIGLTVPAMLAISHFYGHPVTLGLEGPDLVMFALTITVSIITFSSGRTNLMQGAVHLVLFIAYVLLITQQ